ncbi:hypothetical protein LOZ57_003184 [Ophidiomyces ophidiicola]|uniref:uncharacterized protein n=1 Tax=Ophidiomyces ophidiicola TaxID=1387563 RepID=UPI0020C35FD5|nr:uncharacterized protein LOZ57_003184 [Ophidiomyces ophidiicola]KAI1947456.1 hypothetical protein LOZ57_003184 [Ophidiomyces ophidiicola]KAI2092824.1 hypothetical protein LOZ36_000378 [Ophidiomyces ophidiicola]
MDEPTPPRLSSILVEGIINHIALPPSLPGRQEKHLIEIEEELLRRLQAATRKLQRQSNGGLGDLWDKVRQILEICKSTNSRKKLDKSRLVNEFGHLQRDVPVILHITEQNAGLIVWRQTNETRGDHVLFEAFEASAISEKVLAAENALLWDFPGEAIAMPYTEFARATFQDSFAGFLEQASTESIKRFTARAAKAGSSPIEDRDTVNPALIAQVLMTLLEANGTRVFPVLLRKRVRDDVCWASGAEKPWRRSAFWLVIRVCLERYFCSTCGEEIGRLRYKSLLCTLLSSLIDDSFDSISVESLTLLKGKLARRLAKLQIDGKNLPANMKVVYEELLGETAARCQKSLQHATEHIEHVWSNLKARMKRPIPQLPLHADKESVTLSLPNSKQYLQKVMENHRLLRKSSKYRGKCEALSKFITSGDNYFSKFATRYYALSDLEESNVKLSSGDSPGQENERCTEIASRIEHYLKEVSDAYDNSPEQKSVMILSVLRLWMAMDQCAVALFGLLKDFHPAIAPAALDVLQLPMLADMLELRVLQGYLRDRCDKASHRTIFDEPTKGCFAERYYDESTESVQLRSLHLEIELQAQSDLKKKEAEWRKLSDDFEQLEREIAESSCVFSTLDSEELVHDVKQCRKCFLQRNSRRMKIGVHEYPLPSSPSEVKAVIFELACPASFKAYRNATWRLICAVGALSQTQSFKPELLLDDYSQLQKYMCRDSYDICLASKTKSFLRTHYNGMRFPISLDGVCLPNGLRLSYFDVRSEMWVSRHPQALSFARHFTMYLPRTSPFSSIGLSVGFSAPSSYEVIASQTQCPAGLNLHEFLAYKSLFSGNSRRWPSILIELGSTNLNLSTEATTSLISQLAIQAGPADDEDPLRVAHKTFRDSLFCQKLMEQISQRLDSISSNWRETNCMDMLLTLILRLYSIGPISCREECKKILEKGRIITAQWIVQLRTEIHQSTDVAGMERFASFAFWAALLCRRTFSIFVGDVGHLKMTNDGLCCFIEASIMLQDALPVDLARLSPLAKNALIRDLKMVYRMGPLLHSYILSSPHSFSVSIDAFWPQPEGSMPRDYSTVEVQEAPYRWWVCLSPAPKENTRQQTIHYHLLEGHLLFDGQPLKQLPAEHKTSVVLEQLFGKQRLLTIPSPVFGMDYLLAFPINGHQIHIGFVEHKLVVQAHINGSILEYIPPHIFGNPTNFDLPGSLVLNCVHWLNLNTGVMEIRKQPEIWKKKLSNWTVDINTGEAWRRRTFQTKGSMLVDPHSRLFKLAARIFDHFEYRNGLTIFQPPNGKLAIELRRLELSFFVNFKGLLQCRELNAEIDPDQDAGTWYGLDSKIILRDVSNGSRRIILVPIGKIHAVRNDCHVSIQVENEGAYGRYTINNVLGRLDCPAEPVLLYQKARFHAYTSFFVPDPLTGRTGTEEALNCLLSARCQPWTTLNIGPIQALESILKLVPKRAYYPSGLKTMQNVTWDHSLTTVIQHEGLWPAINNIIAKAKILSSFSLKGDIEMPDIGLSGDTFLLMRAYWRRNLYQRADSGFPRLNPPPDLKYEARDNFISNKSRLNVYESVSLIRSWSPDVCVAIDFAMSIQNWNIGGFDSVFDKFLISDLLNIQYDSYLGSLVNLCRLADCSEKHRLMFMFAIMSFRSDVNMLIIRTIIAFAIIDTLKEIEPPKWPSYVNFRYRQLPTIQYLRQLISPCCTPYAGDERNFFQLSYKTRRDREAKEYAYEQQLEKDSRMFAECLLNQWPCAEPKIDMPPKVLIDLPRAMSIIHTEWLRLFQNMELSDYVEKVQHVLNLHSAPRRFSLPYYCDYKRSIIEPKSREAVIPSLQYTLLCHNLAKPAFIALRNEKNTTTKVPYVVEAVRDNSNAQSSSKKLENSAISDLDEIDELTSIVNQLKNSTSVVQNQYCLDMLQSIEALKRINVTNNTRLEIGLPELNVTRDRVQMVYNYINSIFDKLDSRSKWLKDGGLWPCITPISLLEQLRSSSHVKFGMYMKEVIMEYALSIVSFQRSLRIEHARLKGNYPRVTTETENIPHVNWEPMDHPDWILLEIEADISIRQEQVDVARATISPTTAANSVLQMNMGQGKTSCIMPMVAAELADTTRLVRLVVPKALLAQTAQLLQTRLGGLIGREIRHIPFARKTPTDFEMIKEYFDVHKYLKHSSGVIVTLPEHILSFKLSGLQRLSDARIGEARTMVKIHTWMQKWCRDILDECDFTLATRTQLIYPSGSQSTVDGYPNRWKSTQELLQLVSGHLWNLRRDFPQSIEVIPRQSGGFPVVFFLRRDVEDELITRLIRDVIRGQTSILPMGDRSHEDRMAIKSFIQNSTVPQTTTKAIESMFANNIGAKQNIYLLRGLFVHRILLLSLKKRWNVQYGLHPDRDPIAVPFTAKGVPSEQAEWGHPDVAILFTCLAFYFGGLTRTQLRQSLIHLVKSDDPSSEYDRWTQTSYSLPDVLREWSVVETNDEAQLVELWKHLQYQVAAIDYFLNHFVFPKHAKQFQVKLQASGWDIPLFSPQNQRPALTTGFSGTNDNRTLLPLMIRQQDLPALSHTNAEVLTYLLQPRNRRYLFAACSSRKRLSKIDLLYLLQKQKIRVLIDSGAQILEMDNKTLAREWLKIDYEVSAALYFDSENKPIVLYRNGAQTPLLASPYADDLEGCLVYLDEAHTRGTDLKMPPNAVGALTLGLGQTKDHTVQAAMRLRQLGTTQSVVFCAPPEVHQSILDLQGKQNGDRLDSRDVVCWLLKQTCLGIEQIQPLYYSQGMDFCSRTQASLDNPHFLEDPEQQRKYCNAIRQNEKQTLEQLYRPVSKPNVSVRFTSYAPEIAKFVKELKTRRKGFQDFGNAVHGSALQEVEQEREVAFEVEAVREVQKPTRYTGLSFPGLHQDILNFATTGKLSGYAGFQHAFVFLKETGVGQKHGINPQAAASNLFVSKEFMRTVKLPQGRTNDNFLRPVNWLIWSFESETAMIIIPEEADILIPMFQRAINNGTHLITYAAPVTRKMLHFNNLTFYAIPTLPQNWRGPKWLTIQLGILAGRVYFEFEEYQDLCEYLAIEDATKYSDDLFDSPMSPTPFPPGSEKDTTISTEIIAKSENASTFTGRPLVFLQDWLSLKRRGQEFTHTPMGYVCQGKSLSDSHPFFSNATLPPVTKPSCTLQKQKMKRNEVEEKFESDFESEEEADAHNVSEESDDSSKAYGLGTEANASHVFSEAESRDDGEASESDTSPESAEESDGDETSECDTSEKSSEEEGGNDN